MLIKLIWNSALHQMTNETKKLKFSTAEMELSDFSGTCFKL